MLWACLLHEDPSLTLEQVGTMISADNMLGITNKLNETFEAAMPEEGASGRPLAGDSAG